MLNIVSLEDGNDGEALVATLMPGARRIWDTLPDYEDGAVGIFKLVKGIMDAAGLHISKRLLLALALIETMPEEVEDEELDSYRLLGIGWEAVAAPGAVAAFRPVHLPNRRG